MPGLIGSAEQRGYLHALGERIGSLLHRVRHHLHGGSFAGRAFQNQDCT
jgi:hypothetical protein